MMMLIACSKYENGPDFSLRTKTDRLCNNWQVSDAQHVSGDNPDLFTDVYYRYQLNIGKDGQYTITYVPNGHGNYTESGTWKFNDDKTHVLLSAYDGKVSDYTVLKLENCALWIRFTEEGDEWEVHLFPKS